MKYAYILLFLLSLITISCKSQLSKQPVITSKKPNILIVFPDQLRRYSAGFWSEEPYRSMVVGKPDPVVTPNIDKLAKNGIVFTQAVSNYPLCTPYRAMMLSGLYPSENGVWSNARVGSDTSLKDDTETIPDLFFKAGYNTSYFGKCHWLKNEPLFDKEGNYVGTTEAPGGHYINKYDTYIPPKSRHSIEYFFQSVKDDHYAPLVYSNIPSTIDGKKDGELHLPKVFTPKLESDNIISYLQNKNGQRDSNKPFCMIWSLNPPHSPWNDESTDMDEMRAHYDTDKFPMIDENLLVRQNADRKVGNYVRNYYANVTSVDKYIGYVLDELERIGELDNTIVIFSSDHGEMLGSHGRTGKNVIELEASAIPLIVHWPKGLKASTTDLLFSVPDLLPTLMGLTGLKDKIPNKIQGTDFSPFLFNDKSSVVTKPEASLFFRGNARGVFTDRYALCLVEHPKRAKKKSTFSEAFIYDNLKDPYQLNKISLEDSPVVAKKLLGNLASLLKKTNDPWYLEKRYNEVIPY